MAIRLKAGQFFGRRSEVVDTNGFCFAESSYEPSVNLPTHAHELAHFCLVLDGAYSETIGNRSYERVPTTLVYYPTDASHSERHVSRGRHFLIEIGTGKTEQFREFGARLDEPVLLRGHESTWLAARLYREFVENDAFSALALESLTTELLISASRQYERVEENKRPSWLERTIEVLRENQAESLSLGQLADVSGVHPTHLARAFRRFEKCTVGDYSRKVRVEKARDKMLSTDNSLVQIALDTGFADQSHFTRTFKKVTGMTPSQFRSIYPRR